MHAICTGILYCFAGRAVSWLTEMTQNPLLARDGNARARATRLRSRARATIGTHAGEDLATTFCHSTQWSPFRQGKE